MRLLTPAVVIALLLAGTGTAARSAVVADRSTADRPDEVTGAQVHLVYVVPADRPDRKLDTSGAIGKSFALAQSWLSEQTSGRTLRLDTFNGQPDISFLRLSATGSQLESSTSQLIGALSSGLRGAGFDAGKAYLVYTELGTSGCDGIAGVSEGMKIAGVQLLSQVCAGFAGELGSGFGGQAGLWEFGVLHEFFHTLGILGTCSPHVVEANTAAGGIAGHAGDSNGGSIDLMAPSATTFAALTSGSGARMVLDVHHDDYYTANIPNCPDLARSEFLASAATKPAAVSYRVSIAIQGTGTVTSSPAGISCPGRCAQSFPAQSTVRLTARAAKGWRFAGWSGGCAGTKPCSLQPAAPVSVRARFRR